MRVIDKLQGQEHMSIDCFCKSRLKASIGLFIYVWHEKMVPSLEMHDVT